MGAFEYRQAEEIRDRYSLSIIFSSESYLTRNADTSADCASTTLTYFSRCERTRFSPRPTSIMYQASRQYKPYNHVTRIQFDTI